TSAAATAMQEWRLVRTPSSGFMEHSFWKQQMRWILDPPPLDQRQCCRWAYTGEILRLRSGQASWPPDFSLTCELTKRTSLRSFAPTPEAFRPAVFRPAFLSATDLLPARILPSAIRPKHSRNFLSAKSALPPCHRAPGCIPVAASWRNRMPRAARHVALIRALCARV